MVDSSSAAAAGLQNTFSYAEDAGGAPGWSIADNGIYRNRTSTGSWISWSNPRKIRIRGVEKTVPVNAPATGRPAIAGDTLVGSTLTADTAGIADIDGKTRADNADAGFEWTYQWFTVDADGTSNRTPIPGETARTYSLTPADEDLRIIVEASFTDDAGNAEGPLASEATNAVTAPDETAPQAVSAAVNGNRLIVHFDEDLAAAPNLDNSAFAVTKTPLEGTEESATLSGTPVLSGATLTLTLDAALVSTDGNVKVSYAKPDSGSGNFLRDASGNAVADFSDLSVSNNTPGPGEAAAVSVWYVYFDQVEYAAVEGGAGARVTVQLNAPWKPERNEALTVYLSDVELEGGAGESDYRGIPDSVTFQPGQTEASFTVTATNDNVDDDGESIYFGISTRMYYDDSTGTGSFGVNIASGDPKDHEVVKTGRGPSAVTVRFEDNKGPLPVTVSFGAPAYAAAEGGADATVTVRLSERPGRQVVVPLTVTHTDADTGDYSGVPGSLTFGSNQTEKTFDVEAVDDSHYDDLESVTLGFGELPSGVFAGSPASTVVNLDDNDEAPENPESIEETEPPKLTLRFGAAETKRTEVREGIRFSLAVTLEEAADTDIHIPLLIEYTGGATAADVTGLPATLTIEAGELRAHVNGRMVDDADIDPDEGFTVTFGALPAGVEVHDLYDEAHFLIVDNDSYPEINAADESAREPGPGAYVWLVFRVTLSESFDERVRVNYRTVDGTARAGQDYEAKEGTLEFGRRETVEEVWVKVLGDDHDEGRETFTLVLSDPVNATLGDNVAEGRIDNTGRMPGAWLSRFGRAASDRALEAIGQRFAQEDRQTHLTLGGGGFDRLRALGGGLRGRQDE